MSDLDAIEPFDQERHLGRPPWKNGLAVEAWEKAHGHDVRLKCYVEYGCRAIEAENERLRERVATLEGLIREEHQAHHSGCCVELDDLCHIGQVLDASHDQDDDTEEQS